MKIISVNLDHWLETQAAKPLIGFVTGFVRIIMACAQIALNLLIGFFCSRCQQGNFFSDAYEGLYHLREGIVEMMPGSSLCISHYLHRQQLLEERHLLTQRARRLLIDDQKQES